MPRLSAGGISGIHAGEDVKRARGSTASCRRPVAVQGLGLGRAPTESDRLPPSPFAEVALARTCSSLFQGSTRSAQVGSAVA